VANPEVMHRSMSTVHAANICMWLKRDLRYDPVMTSGKSGVDETAPSIGRVEDTAPLRGTSGQGTSCCQRPLPAIPAATVERGQPLSGPAFLRRLTLPSPPRRPILDEFADRSLSPTRIRWTVSKAVTSTWELSTPAQREHLAQRARQRDWGLSLIQAGWLHLPAFSMGWYLTVFRDYHEAAGYLAIWLGELFGLGLIFRLCGGPALAEDPPPLGRLVARVWVSYFLLVFNLGTMNTLRGHQMFELFPATASLASFAFLVLTFAVSWRFFPAVLVMFAAGLLMAAHLPHAYLVFALAWWLVLNGIGLALWRDRRSRAAGLPGPCPLHWPRSEPSPRPSWR
jgi:hypothetical protein